MIFMGCKAFFQEDATPLFGTSWGSACDQPLLSSVLPGAAHAISHSCLRYFLGQRMQSATPIFGTSWGSACDQPLLSSVLPRAAHAISLEKITWNGWELDPGQRENKRCALSLLYHDWLAFTFYLIHLRCRRESGYTAPQCECPTTSPLLVAKERCQSIVMTQQWPEYQHYQ